MAPTSSLVGQATRYLAGRNAVQTVYWRAQMVKNPDSAHQKFVKVSRTCNFGKAPSPPNKVKEMSQIRFH